MVLPVPVSSPVGGLTVISAIGTVQLSKDCWCIFEHYAMMSGVQRLILPAVGQPVWSWENSCRTLVAFLEVLSLLDTCGCLFQGLCTSLGKETLGA